MSPTHTTPPPAPPAPFAPDAIAEMVVTERDLASAHAAAPHERYPEVLATPALIGLIERACAACLQPGLQPGEMSVGVRVSVTHRAPTPLGAPVRAQARWRHTEGALHVFDVEARDAGGIVASGEHARAIVRADQITAAAARRVPHTGHSSQQARERRMSTGTPSTHAPLLHAAFETLPAAEVRRLQEPLWAQQWQSVRGRSAFYQRKLAPWLKHDLTLDDLQDLPLTEKDELRISQEDHAPFGDYVACAEDSVARMHRTSGTTGKPLILANSRADAEWIALIGARSMWASGLRPDHRVVHCLNYCMWTGGYTDHTILEATGATVLPYGVGQTRQLITSIRDLGITAISCTPSYPALLEQVLQEHFPGTAPRDLGLQLGLFGGEAGLDNPDFRGAMEERWGFKVRNANFGMSEVLSILGGQTDWTTDLLYHANDAVFAEILDPATGQRLPIRSGTTGELVCTHLRKECQPLVRYRTRDVVTVTAHEPGPDGRTAWRFRVSGRTDDMFNVRGINVFPSAVRAGIESLPRWCSGQFRIVLRGEGPYDRVDVRAEATEGLAEADWPDAARALEQAVRARVGATTVVQVVPHGHYPRTDGKTAWVLKEKLQ